jgi:hypothetical protein
VKQPTATSLHDLARHIVVWAAHYGAGCALELQKFFLVFLYLLLYVLFVVLNVNELVAHLVHDLSMMSV